MSDSMVNELVEFSQSLHELVSNEIEKYDQMKENIDLDHVGDVTARYLTKLKTLQSRMDKLTRKSVHLKERVDIIKQKHQEHNRKVELEMERVKEMEQSLAPVMVKSNEKPDKSIA